MYLRFIALSGTVSVTENLYVYETEKDLMVVDCGVGFPDLEMPGVDLVIPDFSYVVKNKHKLAGIIVSQAHEDHIGALPFLLREAKAPIWASPLVAEFLKDKFEEYSVKDFEIRSFDPRVGSFEVGGFRIHPFRVTHSVPDTVGFAIDTPQGRVFHVPEHKMDQNPVDEMKFDIERAKALSQGVLFLASDCLGANRPGYTEGEAKIEEVIFNIAKDAKKAILLTAISSNIGRFQQAMNVAQKLDRRVVLVGRSVQKKAEIAHNLGILKYPESLVISYSQAERLAREKILYIVSGCYGQVGSSLYKIAVGEHEKVSIEEGDTVIFSADPAPPYSKESQDFVIDALIDKGADVHYYDLNEGLYVSGHGSQKDILDLVNIVKPRYFIPIGGAIRFMHSYKKLVVANGADPAAVFMLKPGENVFFEDGVARMGKKIPTREVLVHGLGVGDVGKIVLGERSILGSEGIAVAVIKIKRGRLIDNPRIITRGFVFEKIEKELIFTASRRLKKQILRLKGDTRLIEEKTVRYLQDFFFQKTGRRPMILPVVVEV